MRASRVAVVLLSAVAVACGGREGTSAPDGAPAATCAHGSTLVATSSTLLFRVRQAPSPQNGPLTGEYFAALTSLAATPDGDRFLISWDTVDAAASVTDGYAVVAQVGAAGASASSPVAAPTLAQAAFDGSSFVVVGDPPQRPVPDPGQPSLLQMQRFGVAGRATALPVTIESAPIPLVMSVVSTPRGLAVAVLEATAGAAHALLVGADGRVLDDFAFPPGYDPNTGLTYGGPAGLALVQGQVVAAATDTIATLSPGLPTTTTHAPFMVANGSTGLSKFGSIPMFASGDQIMTWGLAPDTLVAGRPYSVGLYAGTPGGTFTRVADVPPSALTQLSDGCGGVVTLLGTNGAIGIQAGKGSAVSLGTSLIGGRAIVAIAPTSTGFGVAWADTDGVHLATLAWR